MGGRGTTDSISLLYQALLKRHEHQQASWVVLLIKEFPGVPRDLLFSILSKFGVPPKMVNLNKPVTHKCCGKIRDTVGAGDDETTTRTMDLNMVILWQQPYSCY